MKKGLTKSDALDIAKQLICGQRETDYGNANDSFKEIAAYWSVYLGITISSEDVALMMSLMKIARISTGKGTADSFIDAIGYIALGAEIHSNLLKDKK